MQTLTGHSLELKGTQLHENIISDNFTQKRYNLKAIKNLYIQDLRTTNRRTKGFVTGAIIGGMIDSSIGDDSIIDGAIIGGLLGSSTSNYVTGNIYVTIQFYDNQTLNVQIDNDSELMILQEYAIKNHNDENSKLLDSLVIVNIDKKVFNSTLNASRITSLFTIFWAVIIGVMNHYSVFDIKTNELEPITNLSIALASPFIISCLSMLAFAVGVYQFFNAGGKVVIKVVNDNQ